MSYRFVIADVFTETAFGGNQLAVFPDARGLSERAMQALAREFNFAETTFVLPPEDARHARRVRIFAPKKELPFAGHPTIGTTAVLAQLGFVTIPDRTTTFVLEEGIGPVAVEVLLGGAAPFARFRLEQEIESPSHRPERRAAAVALGLPENVIEDAWFAAIGVPFAFIRLADKAAVDRAFLDRAAWSEHFAHAWASNMYLFTGSIEPESHLYVRMFAPAAGVDEDAATGSGAAILAGCLAARLSERDGIFAWRIEQGTSMGRPSAIEIQAEKRAGRVVAVWVGGHTVVVGEGSMSVAAGY
ncbi:MAG: PhzF family phenazine biosynthesis protein [Acidimicrobiia bacterium]|nr:PhzF family phenazine biosynthesis protein [Acidimicrobiia bacterium]